MGQSNAKVWRSNTWNFNISLKTELEMEQISLTLNLISALLKEETSSFAIFNVNTQIYQFH